MDFVVAAYIALVLKHVSCDERNYWTFAWPYRLISFTNFNVQFIYSLTICMVHYNPRHVSSINMPIFRRTNCTITASGIVTLCKRLYSTEWR